MIGDSGRRKAILAIFTVQSLLAIASVIVSLVAKRPSCCPPWVTISVSSVGAIFYSALTLSLLQFQGQKPPYAAVAFAAGIHGGLILGLALNRQGCLTCHIACGLIWGAMMLVPSQKFASYLIRYSAPSFAAAFPLAALMLR